ncbi:MAG: hypothetical protein J6S76_04625 [Clostridia bacterium]|nr:hypothetical protein [Clostridia bacterium]
MNIKDQNACACIASKIKEIRQGNRLMLNDDVNITMNLYRRDTPDKRCGVVKINGNLDFSLLDAAMAAAAGFVVLRILGAITSFLRRI